MGKTTFGLKLDEDTQTRLKKLAQVKRRSSHWLMKEAIAQYLETEERYELEKREDEERYQTYLDTNAHLTHEEMMAWLDQLVEKAARKKKK